ncbi:SHOCT domain-containing protein [Shimia thalassica]|uniref:SHOCT domain-containing protein n=1 Tax=Shimia thalassica TaxID=1715693 RepID=A0A0P1IJD4_9RHOB|nr:SHOCT domain-containing protein [Shimia thalassica]MBU2943688.1 DMAP1-binding domain-containing protein [Shimia thalassica]MDO6478500.1 SHOCT domain-containing protein [Shimia thalassica]MDO6484771.1 SHOCT domain-containing protein [Shimia thalassica]MDO6501759.1 SHOCT domain-containing protein [Shimia thalassica]MDP2517055.1 SHOCT domain-containing protein [Shimia thalassica]
MESIAKIAGALAVAGLLLSACGNGGNTTNNVSTTTVGEELASLETAYASGLLTEKEYEAQRKKILEKKK